MQARVEAGRSRPAVAAADVVFEQVETVFYADRTRWEPAVVLLETGVGLVHRGLRGEQTRGAVDRDADAEFVQVAEGEARRLAAGDLVGQQRLDGRRRLEVADQLGGAQ